MSIQIYSADRTKRHELTHATSLQMTRYYNNIGKFTLVLPADDYNISLIEDEGILYDTETDSAFVILARKCDSDANEITVNGYTTDWLLNKRTAATKTTVTNVETGVYSAVTSNLRSLPGISNAATKSLTETADAIIYGGQLLDSIMPVLEDVQLGHRMKWDTANNAHVFEVYKGADRTSGIHAVIFSEERGTAAGLVISSDISDFANVIYVPGYLTNDTETVVTVGSASGSNRFEYWMNSEERQESGESSSDFNKRLTQIGREQAAEMVKRLSFDVKIDPSEFNSLYGLGDIVKCDSRRFDISFNARVTAVKFAMDKNGKTTSVTLGEPVLTVIGEMRLKK